MTTVESFKKTEFVTDRQWDGMARRLEKKNFEQRGVSLSATSIASSANSFIVEIQSDRGGMLVTVGWREVMETEAAKLTRKETEESMSELEDAALIKMFSSQINQHWNDVNSIINGSDSTETQKVRAQVLYEMARRFHNQLNKRNGEG